ncbi:hypothetical protein DLAC_11777 [Tieghemostelium lacteum]|uniref:Uncharacterized protein n=1 Tax=Tieghemostelium lacteum TaxID=361077 RepID=A0A151Z6H8_TIELA|nr:hypothetical protein DLAC_11777 [Tieghemostelium lacteum]|eukprot:KYQ89560.1 hypothetical protein DLAC_11777 [Tieghemostelium lacteum]
MKLPLIIIKEILDYLLSFCKNTIRLWYFIKKFTLISKEWNRSVLPKLNVRYSFYIDSESKISHKVIKQAHKFGIKFNGEYSISKNTSASNLVSKENIRTLEVTNVTDISEFTNINTLRFFIPLKEFGMVKQFPISQTVKYSLCLPYMKHVITDNSTYETLFSQSIFYSINIKVIELNLNHNGFSLNNGNQNLKSLNLIGAYLDFKSLEQILEKCENLEYIKLSIPNWTTQMNSEMLDKLALLPLKLDLLEINQNQSVYLKSYLNLLSKTKSRIVNIKFINYYCQSKEEMFQKVNSPSTKIMHFHNGEYITNNNGIEYKEKLSNVINYNFTHLENFYIYGSYYKSVFPIEEYDFSNLISVSICGFDSFEPLPTQSQAFIQGLVSLNLVKMRTLVLNLNLSPKFQLTEYSIIENALKNNNNLTSLTVSNMFFSQITTFNHPTITKLNVGVIHCLDSQIKNIVSSISKNKNLLKLKIMYFPIQDKSYNFFDAYFEILTTNKTLISLYLPEGGKYDKPKHDLQYENLLSNSKIMNRLTNFYIPNNEIQNRFESYGYLIKPNFYKTKGNEKWFQSNIDTYNLINTRKIYF